MGACLITIPTATVEQQPKQAMGARSAVVETQTIAELAVDRMKECSVTLPMEPIDLATVAAGMFNNTSEGAARGGDAGAGMFSNQSDGANRTAGSGGAGMFDNSGDTETRPGNNAGMFDNSGASETRTGGGAGMFDNTGDGNKNLEAREHGEKEKGVKGMLHKAKQAFVPK